MKLHYLPLLSVALFAACKQPAAHTPSSPAAQAPQPAVGPRLPLDTVVAEWDGRKLTYGDLMKKKEGSFKKLYNKYLQDLHEAEQQAILEEFVNEGAKKAGKTAQEFVQSAMPPVDVPEAEIQAFYDVQVKPSGQPLEAVHDRIRDYLKQQKQQGGVKQALDKIKADGHFAMKIPAPTLIKAEFDFAGRPSKGPANAKITVVEFSDFQCPYCSRAVPAVEQLLKEYPNDVRVVFMHFPLNFHEKAMPAAIAAQCANTQGKFWEFHDKLFANQGGLSPEMFTATAKEVGLDEAKFSACLADPATKTFVEKDMETGENVGVEGTPSFFVNGTPNASGPPTTEQIKALL